MLILLILIGCFFCSSAQQSALKFSSLTIDNGLSHTDANDIKQDTKGFIWIATLSGLDRFDGYTIKRFYNKAELKNSAFKNRLRSICPDTKGNIWLGTEDGIECFDSRTERYIGFEGQTHAAGDNAYTHLLLFNNNQLAAICRGELRIYQIIGKTLTAVTLDLPSGISFTSLITDGSAGILLSSTKGIWHLDKGQKLKLFKFGERIDDSAFSGIYRDRQNNLLLFNRSHVRKLPAGTSNDSLAADFIAPSAFMIRDLIQDKTGNYWVSTDKGLFYLSPQLKEKQFITDKSYLNSINTNYLDKLFIDRSDCLWICTSGGGINYADLNAKMFFVFQHTPEAQNTLSGNHIKSVLEEDTNKVWIGTDGNGLNAYDFTAKKFTHFSAADGDVRLKSNVVTALSLDADRNLWIGGAAGIDILNSGRTGLIHLRGSEKFPVYGIDVLTIDVYGNMWFGNHNALGCIWHDQHQQYHVRYYDSGYFILSDRKRPEIFVSTIQGLNRFVVNRRGEILKTFHYRASRDQNSLSSDYPYPVVQQNDSTYWIGTIGGGLDQLILKKDDTYQVKVFGKQQHIFEDVESLEISRSGKLWIGGNGLEKFDPLTGKVIRYDKNDGLQSNSFKVGSSFNGKSGRLYFGGINGLNYFFPDSIKSNKLSAIPVLTDIQINNKKVAVGEDSATLPAIKQVLAYDQNLRLNYLQNNFVIYFSSMHFANPLKCSYRYQLQGYDKEWKYADGHNPNAAYSNLDYKTYTFIVQATNNDGLWSKDSATISLTITPPWWKSAVAEICYLILLITFLACMYRYQARWYLLKAAIAIRDIEEKRREEAHLHREELYQQQLDFFTNISHEFRTPLSLILGPLESLMAEQDGAAQQPAYQSMLRNTKRLINLINELMNFRKVADSVIRLQVRPVMLNLFISHIAEEFSTLAAKKAIKFTLVKPAQEITNWFDVQLVEKILFNLLSNAFKYTEPDGTVSLELFLDWPAFLPGYENGHQLTSERRAEKYMYFRVADTGIGISKDSISKIFDRFYRVSNNHLGSGVGLALVKSLTLIHKGDIFVYSERHAGTEFIIGLPLGDQYYSAAERGDDMNSRPPDQLEKIDHSVGILCDHLPSLPAEERPSLPCRQHILIVEDNDELRDFLKGVLWPHYHISEAANGQLGLEIAIAKLPDLVISDVMMPVMNGVTLCRQLKENFETSHIPFMILSARDALDSKIQGMQSGADYYFSKPISIELLLLTVHNLLEQKNRLKLKFTREYYTQATELVNTEKDKEFMAKLLKVIGDHLSNPELDVDFLCQHLFISRTKLYQKIKGVSGQSVSEFIRTVRLKKAVHIMTHEDIAVNELAYRTGFTSSAYFSTAFKKEFGRSPMQFLQFHKKKLPYSQ